MPAWPNSNSTISYALRASTTNSCFPADSSVKKICLVTIQRTTSPSRKPVPSPFRQRLIRQQSLPRPRSDIDETPKDVYQPSCRRRSCGPVESSQAPTASLRQDTDRDEYRRREAEAGHQDPRVAVRGAAEELSQDCSVHYSRLVVSTSSILILQLLLTCVLKVIGIWIRGRCDRYTRTSLMPDAPSYRQ